MIWWEYEKAKIYKHALVLFYLLVGVLGAGSGVYLIQKTKPGDFILGY